MVAFLGVGKLSTVNTIKGFTGSVLSIVNLTIKPVYENMQTINQKFIVRFLDNMGMNVFNYLKCSTQLIGWPVVILSN